MKRHFSSLIRLSLLGLISTISLGVSAFALPVSSELNGLALELAFGKNQGCMVLKKSVITQGSAFAAATVSVTHNAERAKVAFSPYSTFKIPSSLIALNLGIVTDIDKPMFQWNSEKCSEVEAAKMGLKEKWCKDLSLKQAFEASAVWVFKELAGQYGEKTMKSYLNLFQYGNQNMEKSLTTFWLGEGLKISANDQIKFLQKFHTKRLGLKAETYEKANKLFTMEETDKYVLKSKTGTGPLPSGKYIGWYVGIIEVKNAPSADKECYYFAMNVEGKNMPEVTKMRKDILERVMRAQGLTKD